MLESDIFIIGYIIGICSGISWSIVVYFLGKSDKD